MKKISPAVVGGAVDVSAIGAQSWVSRTGNSYHRTATLSMLPVVHGRINPPDIIARRRKALEIERELDKHRRPRKTANLAGLRLGELYRIGIDRYGNRLWPDCHDVRALLYIIACHLCHLDRRDPAKRIGSHYAHRAPWMPANETSQMIAMCLEDRRTYRADGLARLLEIDSATRTRLSLRTIGAIDQTAAQRESMRNEASRLRSAKRRRQDGARPPLLSLSSVRPWEAWGISRATYYRHRERYDREIDEMHTAQMEERTS